MRDLDNIFLEQRIHDLEKNGTGGGSSADKISYNNSESGLTSTNVQSAIDEVHEEVKDLRSNFIIGNTTTSISLNDYSKATPFIVPVDGYCRGNAIKFVFNEEITDNYWSVNSNTIFVKKGMKLFNDGTGAIFIPLENYE